MTPTSHCYFDYYQANPAFQPEAIGGLTTLKEVYGFDPVPPQLSEVEAKNILGGQANLWTEFIKTPEHAEYMVLPRMSALAEAIWTAKEEKDWLRFRSNLETQLKRFEAMDANYSAGSFQVSITTAGADREGSLLVVLESEHPNLPIHYTLDGSYPSTASPIYTEPIPVKWTTQIRAGLFIDGQVQEQVNKKEIVFHKASGKSIRFANPYHYQYPSSGQGAIVDGFLASRNQNDRAWQAWEGDDMVATIDLGEETIVNSISSKYLQYQRAMIFLPESVTISISLDGVNFSPLDTINHDHALDRRDMFTHDFVTVCEGTSARFIRVHAKNIAVCPDWHYAAGLKTWLFIDEVIVR
jgi:hexosaminidase